MGGMGAAAALRAPTPASGAGSLPRASSLAARRVFGAAPRPGRVRRLGSRARACTRVRASGGGLFGALPSAADATRFASEVKSTELELSRGMWRAFDAGVASASDALARAGEASTSGVSVAATRAADAAARFLPESLRASLSDAAHAALAAIPPEVLDAAGDIPEHPALVAFFLVAALGGRSILPSPSTSGSAARGMDEWAALAAAEGEDEPAELREYDPKAIQEYFKRRPLTLLRRGLRSGSLLGAFGASLWLDKKILGDEPSESKKAEVDARRAAQLKDLLVSLGPTYVKLGQVLSSRQDLLPAPYVMELRTLQDAVPPFDDALARRILDQELGASGSRALNLGDAPPIASASLGQVYRGTIVDAATGETESVAVKVQRPGALAAISLDVGIIRAFAEPWRRFKGLNTDLEGLVDEWGRRFVEELDYGREAANGERFRLAMESRPDLAGVVTAAPVVARASTRRVLTTGWIDGQRLDTSEEGDVPRLCAVALASYLAMLLDIGVLHADPHPGNLFRTSDGKLCILDWGLVTPVSPELSNSILAFIAHLVSKDFDRVPADLDAMGFIPAGKREAMEDAGVASAIGLLFSALAKGGGAEGFRQELGLPDEAKIKEIRKELKGVKDMKVRREKFLEASGGAESKVGQLTRDLEGIQEKYGNIFQIPSYFGYILRSFSVLEGIGLASDKNYSIANECYPYVARRLLTDDAPETRAALEQLLYGKSGPKAQLSVRRVKQLAKAFGNYSDFTVDDDRRAPADVEETAVAGGSPEVRPKKLSKGAREALRLAFDPAGGPVQDILLREMARYAGAAASEAAASVAAAPASALVMGLAEAQQAAAEAMGPARPPVPTALELLAPISAATRQTESDRETLRVAAELGELVSSFGGASKKDSDSSAATAWIELPVVGEVPAPRVPDAPVDLDLLRELADMAPELEPGVRAAALRFGAVLLDQAAGRVAEAEEREKLERA
jgi:aarF domain-containing kinase